MSLLRRVRPSVDCSCSFDTRYQSAGSYISDLCQQHYIKCSFALLHPLLSAPYYNMILSNVSACFRMLTASLLILLEFFGSLWNLWSSQGCSLNTFVMSIDKKKYSSNQDTLVTTLDGELPNLINSERPLWLKKWSHRI